MLLEKNTHFEFICKKRGEAGFLCRFSKLQVEKVKDSKQERITWEKGKNKKFPGLPQAVRGEEWDKLHFFGSLKAQNVNAGLQDPLGKADEGDIA